ncbi:low affinity iron permease family protein [Sphingomonas humi]|uniref:Low affinity iron permease family protein n=1 Tax=Sphingomonas humi TaxID=335630 RepID=A0ABP7RNV0_9SPHN
MAQEKNSIVRLGDRFSDAMSKLFAHPATQIGVIIFCVAWFWFGFHADGLTAALSILAITLTQMVLNGQFERESEARRRDVAMHAKLDELIHATKRARDEMVGIEEELDEEQIRELREEAKQLVQEAAVRTNDIVDGERAKRAIEQVGDGK